MAITFNTNVSALTSQRYLGIAADKTASSLAKLSSGSRVPTAKDDAAALAIGTKLKAEVTSLNQAGNNAAQAVTLLQIADGALSTTSDILNRMKSLAVQASSGQLADAERSLLNQEFQNLKDEVDRIAGVTNFNGNVLLNGGDVAVAQTESKNGGLSALGIDAKFDGASIGDGDAFRVTYAYTAPTNTNGTDEDAVGNLTVTNLTTGESQTIDISAMIRAKTGQARDTTGEGALGDGVMTTDLSAGQTVEVNFAAVGVTLTLNDNFNVDASIDGAVAEVGAAGTAAAGTLAAVGNYVFNTAGGARGITGAGIAELEIVREQWDLYLPGLGHGAERARRGRRDGRAGGWGDIGCGGGGCEDIRHQAHEIERQQHQDGDGDEREQAGVQAEGEGRWPPGRRARSPPCRCCGGLLGWPFGQARGLHAGCRLLGRGGRQRLSAEGGLDHLGEGFGRQGAGDRRAVDEEERRAAGAHLLGVGEVGGDDGLDLGRGAVGVELLQVELQVLRQFDVEGVSQELLAFPQLGGELPVFALHGRGLGGVGRRERLLVEIERQVLGHPADAAAVAFFQLGRGGLHAGAEGALEIDELDDGDGRVGRTLGGVFRADGVGAGGHLQALLVGGDGCDQFVAVLLDVLADDGLHLRAGEVGLRVGRGGAEESGDEGPEEQGGGEEAGHGCSFLCC